MIPPQEGQMRSLNKQVDAWDCNKDCSPLTLQPTFVHDDIELAQFRKCSSKLLIDPLHEQPLVPKHKHKSKIK